MMDCKQNYQSPEKQSQHLKLFCFVFCGMCFSVGHGINLSQAYKVLPLRCEKAYLFHFLESLVEVKGSDPTLQKL